MSNPFRFALALAIASGAMACDHAVDLASPRVIAEDLRGTWFLPGGVPGSSTRFTLAVSDTTISGSGTFSIEAGASGTIAVSGTIAGTVVKLDFLRSIGQHQHFVGALTAPDALYGSFWTESAFGSPPVVITFRRASP